MKTRIDAERLLSHNRLEGSLHNLFLYLWAPTPSGARCPYIAVPDTIIIRHGRPVFWVYTNRSGQIKMKKEETVQSKSEILTTFCDGTSEKSTVGLFITAGQTKDQHACVESLTSEQLSTLLDTEKGMQDGVLQHYTQGFADGNTILCVTWMPGFVEIERICIRKGWTKPKHAWEETPLSETNAHLNDRVRNVCDAVTKHIRQASPQKYDIVKMMCLMKIDVNGRLWFMFCQHLTFKKASDNPYEDRGCTVVIAKPHWMEKRKKASWDSLHAAPPATSPHRARDDRPEREASDASLAASTSALSLHSEPSHGSHDHSHRAGKAHNKPPDSSIAEEGGEEAAPAQGEDSSAHTDAEPRPYGRPKVIPPPHAGLPPPPPKGPAPFTARRDIAPRPGQRDGARATQRQWPELSLSRHARPLPLAIKKALGLIPRGVRHDPADHGAVPDSAMAYGAFSVLPGNSLKDYSSLQLRREASEPHSDASWRHPSPETSFISGARVGASTAGTGHPPRGFTQESGASPQRGLQSAPAESTAAPKMDRGTSPGVPAVGEQEPL